MKYLVVWRCGVVCLDPRPAFHFEEYTEYYSSVVCCLAIKLVVENLILIVEFVQGLHSYEDIVATCI